jgi:hypothetical protein
VQSTESAVAGGGIVLNYGAVHNNEADALAIGHEVVDTLRRHGLRPVWNGTWEQRLEVPMDWKRRSR